MSNSSIDVKKKVQNYTRTMQLDKNKCATRFSWCFVFHLQGFLKPIHVNKSQTSFLFM